MDQVIVYENPTAEGGISIVIPAPKARGTVLVTAAVTRDVLQIVEVDTGHVDEAGNPILEKQRRKIGEDIVTPEERRDETDDEFLARIAAKDVPPLADGTARPHRIMAIADALAERAARVAGAM